MEEELPFLQESFLEMKGKNKAIVICSEGVVLRIR